MAKIKEESDAEQSCSDTWLHDWVNPKQEIKEEHEKPSLQKFKYDTSKDEDVNQLKFENNRKKLVSSAKSKRRLTKRKGDQIINAKSKKSRNGNLSQKAIDTNVFALKKKALENAPVSDIIKNLCEFQCPQCKRKYFLKNSLQRHLKNTNHGSMTTRESVMKYMAKIVVHKCHVCSKKILCEIVTVRSHIKRCHGIASIKIYCEKYGLTYEIRKSNIAKNEVKQMCQNLIKNQTATFFVGNLCSFKCSKCEYSCHSWRLMTKHVNDKSHGLLLKPSAYLSSIRLHKCQMCQELLLCDYLIIKDHIKNKHKTKMAAYNSLFPHIESLNTRYLKELRSYIQDVPSVTPQNKWVLKPHTLPEELLTGSVGNITFFQCHICSATASSFNQLRKHCKTKHSQKYLPYDRNLVVEARYHKCYICHKQVLCDNTFLIKHITSGHKVPMAQYIKNHVLKSKNKVFPTFSDYRSNNNVLKESFDKHQNVPPHQESSDNGQILPAMISSESQDSDEETM